MPRRPEASILRQEAVMLCEADAEAVSMSLHALVCFSMFRIDSVGFFAYTVGA